MGVRSAAPLSQFMGYYLDFMMRNVRTVASRNRCDVFERMIHITEKDVFIGICFSEIFKPYNRVHALCLFKGSEVYSNNGQRGFASVWSTAILRFAQRAT